MTTLGEKRKAKGVIKNTGAFGQANTYLPPELFKPAIIIIKRSKGGKTLSKLLLQALAEHINREYKPKEILGMIEEYNRIESKPKNWW